MAVFLTILKIIGIVLLCLLCLILLIVSLILFVPIRYRIKADKPDGEDDPVALLKITYLLHIISGRISYDKKIDRYIKLFGIRIWPGKVKEHKDTESDTVHSEAKEDNTADQVNVSNEPADLTEESIQDKPEYTIDWNEESAESAQVESADDDRDLFDIIENIVDNIQRKYTSFSEKYDSVVKEIRFWDKMVNDERNRSAVDYVKNMAIRLLKRILPLRVKGFIHFGFDDPATTGKVLVYLAMIYPSFPRKLIIDPGFEDTGLYGNIDIKGNIRLITVGAAALKVFFNKDCRRLWRIYKKHSGKHSG